MCLNCGRTVDSWPEDDEITLVDSRLEMFAQANITLLEAALEETRRQLAVELLNVQSLEIELDRFKAENTKLRLVLAGRNRK